VFVAGFIGSPAMNLVRCRVARAGDTTWIENAHFRVSVPLPPGDRRDVILGIRPHDVGVGARPGSHASARADVIQPVGSETLVQFELRRGDDATRITAAVPPAAELALDDEVGLHFELGRIHVFDAETGTRIELPGGPPGS
jgi:multiple sugar transport system ATP-binding protein